MGAIGHGQYLHIATTPSKVGKPRNPPETGRRRSNQFETNMKKDCRCLASHRRDADADDADDAAAAAAAEMNQKRPYKLHTERDGMNHK